MKCYHAHFDCFSGAAGDMMLAACLDAADSLSNGPALLSPTNDASENTAASEQLLSRITDDLEKGMPELKGEFRLSTQRVWRSMGRIAARKVDVESVYEHEAAPVPSDGVGMEENSHNHSHEHGHHHEHGYHHDHEHKHDHSHNHNHETEKHTESHSHEHSHNKRKEDPHDHNHQHTHNHSHLHSHNHSKLRNLTQISSMLQTANPSNIPPIVSSLAIEAFTELAHAEMHTHGASSLDSVHFHEVGAVDSIVDTVGTLLALYYLGVDLGDVAKDGTKGKMCAVSCSRLPLGEGTVWTDHGLLPVPAPATQRLMIGMPTCPGPKGVTGELVTPTAAALLRVLTGVSSSNVEQNKSPYWQSKGLAGRPPCFTPRAVGVGAGTKDFEKHANILRLVLGDDTQNQVEGHHESAIDSSIDEKGSDKLNATDEDSSIIKENWDTNRLTQLEANIDDATPELLAHAVDLLLQNGAIDAWITPMVMKKGRPAHTLNCLCHSGHGENNNDAENRLLEIIFKHTTTLGIRIQRDILRAALDRRFVEVQLPQQDNSRNGKVNVKISSFKDGTVTSVKAEFDHCKIISEESDVPLKLVTSAAERLAWDQL